MGDWGGWVVADVKFDDNTISNVTFPWKDGLDDFSNSEGEEISAMSGGSPKEGYLALYKGIPAVYWNNRWRKISTGHNNEKYNEATEALK
jgi:hypothetical protein